MLYPMRAWGWGRDGHEIVARIAADNLTPAAQSHAAKILGVSADQRGIATAMAEAAIRPDDSGFREEYPVTKSWHFIDLCLQNPHADIARECPDGNCATDKIDEYAKRLKEANYDRWGAAGDLAFLIHFVGDIHQPLHAANDADRGGNCIRAESYPPARNLHDAWDNAIVRGLEDRIDSGRPETTARILEQTYASEKARDVWLPGHTDDIALESNEIARTDIYGALHIPVEPCEVPDLLCRTHPNVDLSSTYMDQAGVIAGHQLAKAGFRLASLLNEIWTQPAGSNDAPRASNPPPQVLSSQAVAGPIIGNRRHHIYAWPGCGSYDTMAPLNRVMFPSREAAEQAGYRAAHNCP
jgi:nuclease S1